MRQKITAVHTSSALTGYGHRLIHIVALSMMAACLMVSSALAQAGGDCPAQGATMQNADDCKNSTYLIPQDTKWQYQIQGNDPPASWLDCGNAREQSATGCLNTGGLAGAISQTGMEDPGTIPSDNSGGPSGANPGGGGGGPPGGGGGGGGGGGSACNPPTTLPGGCDIYGDRAAITPGTHSGQCGSAVDLAVDWVTITENANAGLIVSEGDSTLYAYTTQGNNLVYNTSSPFLAFYCRFVGGGSPTCNPDREPCGSTIPPEVEIVPTPPVNQYIAIGSGNSTAAVAIPRVNANEEFIVLRRNDPNTLAFAGPPPNPGYFTSRGAVNVDPLCIPRHELLEPLPADFGDMRFRHTPAGSCSIDYAFPATSGVDPADDPCLDYTQYLNTQNMSMYAGAGQSYAVGTVGPGGNSFFTNTVRPNNGTFTTDPTGNLVYDGSYATLGGSNYTALSTSAGTREYNYINGAAFALDSTRTVYTDPPGRVRVQSNGVMTLIDGGTLEDNAGNTIRVFAPMSSVQFDPNSPIQGVSLGNIALPASALIPALPGGAITQPHNAAAALNCP